MTKLGIILCARYEDCGGDPFALQRLQKQS